MHKEYYCVVCVVPTYSSIDVMNPAFGPPTNEKEV